MIEGKHSHKYTQYPPPPFLPNTHPPSPSPYLVFTDSKYLHLPGRKTRWNLRSVSPRQSLCSSDPDRKLYCQEGCLVTWPWPFNLFLQLTCLLTTGHWPLRSIWLNWTEEEEAALIGVGKGERGYGVGRCVPVCVLEGVSVCTCLHAPWDGVGAEVGWCVGGGWVGGSGKDTNLNATGSMGEGKRASIQPIRMPATAKARKNAPHLYAPHRNLSESSTHMKRNHVSSHIYIYIFFKWKLYSVLCCIAVHVL